VISGLLRILGATVGAYVLDFQPSGAGTYVPVALVGWDASTIRALRVLEKEGSLIHPCCAALARVCPRKIAATVTARRDDVISTAAWYACAYVREHLLPARLDHPLFSRKRLSGTAAIQGIDFYRATRDPPFDEADRHLLHLFHRECGALLEPPAWLIDASVRGALPRREAQALDLLLDGYSDKEIAERMGITRHTVNDYTKSIYLRYGIRSRSALIARLRGGHSRP
jgi:DNA-binding CsgD family transcriptional regulator